MGCSSGVVEELEEEEKRYQLKVNLRDEIIILIFDNSFYKIHIKDFHKFMKNLKSLIYAWGLGIGDWGLGIGDWAQSPSPNPQCPVPNPHVLYNSNIFNLLKIVKILNY